MTHVFRPRPFLGLLLKTSLWYAIRLTWPMTKGVALDPHLIYLVAINAVAFLAFTIDAFACRRFEDLPTSRVRSLFLGLLPFLGGAVGTLFALVLFGGLSGSRRMRKDNVAWWFLSFVSLVVWGLITATKLGLVTLVSNVQSLTSAWNTQALTFLGIYLIVLNIITIAAFAKDKHVAANGNNLTKRIPEAWLLALSFAGGSLGGLIAMYGLRHKTRKLYFVWGLPVFTVLHIVVVLFAHMAGVI